MTTIQLDNLSFSYKGKPDIIKDLTLNIPSNSFSLLIGPTGCGKSTLLKLIAGLYPKYAGISSGKINLNGLKQAMMFQNPSEQFTMATPRDEIIFALENLDVDQKHYEKRLNFAIEFAHIEKLLDKKIVNLSGGEKQRVALATLVAMDIDLFLLDEPFASVDPEARHYLINKLSELKKMGKTIIISDHVLDDYEQLCDQVYAFDHQIVNRLTDEKKRELFAKNQAIDLSDLHFKLPNKDGATVFELQDTRISLDRLLLKQDNLKLYQGTSTLITGKNGIGKTSLFKALTKIIPYDGHIFYQGQELMKLKAKKYLFHVAQIFQNADDQFLTVTVQDELNLSKKHRHPYYSDEKIDQLLKELKLTDHLDQVVYSLSGGQKKKLQILLMLISQQEILLFDEPLAGLDHQSVKQVLSLMKESKEKLHRTFLIISHQISDLADLCDYHLNFSNLKLHYSEVPYES